MKRLRICLVNPRFEPSYWSLSYALPLYPRRKRCTMITGALPHLAGLVPEHEVYLLDENVEEIDFEFLKGFDIVGVTGMVIQKDRMLAILRTLREMGVFTVVGGGCASVEEGLFDGLCDMVFSGEADETWPEFVKAFASGKEYRKWYVQARPTDMTTVPKSRFDLLKVDFYASGAIQFSRGCPFECEFCDAVITFGRRPRTKRPEQVIEELDDMRKAGFFSCMIVDDNFIGNKKAAKELLRRIIPWQEEHRYPLKLMIEASINLADDVELLDLLYRANCRSVFIGIETPRTASLKETRKFQNTAGEPLEKKLARIRDAGLDISSGFILGFDHDDETIFDDQFRFIQDNGILLAMVGIRNSLARIREPSCPGSISQQRSGGRGPLRSGWR
ncbi:MAG: B12-binding domain-containing radical SAM protein [Limisphaerales bacterium]